MSRTHLLSAAAAFCLLALAGCDKGPKTGAGAPTTTAPAGPVAPTAGAAPAAAATPAAAAAATPTGTTFGAGVKLASSTPIATILADPKAYAGKSVRVDGMIVDVCPKRGCWMDLAGTAPGEKIKFKVTDGEMVFPVDAKGKYATAEGVITVKELSLEDSVAYAKYQAEEYGGGTFDPASVTAPITVVKLDGTGAVLRDRL